MKLNHALLMCENITAMEDFFIRIIGFENGPRPPFPFAGSWLYSDGQPLIHLVGKTPSLHKSRHKSNHNRLICEQ
ncbi:hypothetical protein [Aliamphritea spongicola]|nr:hypothetical protein [Aliamphritea spongicola]